MKRTERNALWTAVAIVGAGVLVLGVVLTAKLSQIDDTLAGLGLQPPPSAFPVGGPSALPSGPASDSHQRRRVAVEVAGFSVLTDTVSLTVTVEAYGAGDLLYEPPVLSDGAQQLPIISESLEAARWAFLELVTAGRATAALHFAGSMHPADSLWLLFNPGQDPASALAPQVWVELDLQAEGDGADGPGGGS
jgi:hypothetical protein